MQIRSGGVVGIVSGSHAARRLAQGIQASVALVLVLLAYGWRLAPAAVPIAAAAVLLAYALFAHVSVAIAKRPARESSG